VSTATITRIFSCIVSPCGSTAAYWRVSRACRIALGGGRSGTSEANWLPLVVMMRPVPEAIIASVTPSCSRRLFSVSGHIGRGVSDSSTATLRAFCVRSASSESSAVRPSVSPDSSPRSTGTANHDSIERPTNCTETR